MLTRIAVLAAHLRFAGPRDAFKHMARFAFIVAYSDAAVWRATPVIFHLVVDSSVLLNGRCLLGSVRAARYVGARALSTAMTLSLLYNR